MSYTQTADFDISLINSYEEVVLSLSANKSETVLIPKPENRVSLHDYIVTEQVLDYENFIITSRKNNRDVLIVGEPGVGKTTFVRYLADKYKWELFNGNPNHCDLGYFPGSGILDLGKIGAALIRGKIGHDGNPNHVVLFFDDSHYYTRSFFEKFKAVVDPLNHTFQLGNLQLKRSGNIQIIFTANNKSNLTPEFLQVVDVLEFKNPCEERLMEILNEKYRTTIEGLRECQIVFFKLWNERMQRPASIREVLHLFNRTISVTGNSSNDILMHLEKEVLLYINTLDEPKKVVELAAQDEHVSIL